MVEDKRKLGKGSQKWLVCPDCGVREKKDAYEPPIEQSINGMFKRDRKGIYDEQNNHHYR